MKIAWIFFLGLIATIHVSATDLTVNASLNQESCLPGIPVTVRLDVTNGGKAEAKVPRLVGLGVTPAHQAAFAAGEVPEERMHTIPGFYEDDELVVRPGETRRFELPLGETLASGWFADPRLWKPGRFSLQVYLGEKLGAAALDEAIKTQSFISGVLRSNEMELTVEGLEGDEARVWEAILTQTEGRGPARTRGEDVSVIASKLFDPAHPNRYSPYLGALVWIGDQSALMHHYETILSITPAEHPVAQQLRLTIAQMELASALKQLAAKPDDAAALASARMSYAAIGVSAEKANSADVRAQAEQAIQTLANKEITERLRSAD